MTTTNTSNLNLAKPDVGSEANNWGNILNSSLDDVDKAIAQRLVKPVGGSSDVTLTLTDSKFAVIEFTGTLAGNINVKTYANDAKPYIVFNNTSGSYSLTFKSNTGGGVALTQGQKTIVYSDGTNMVSAVDTSQLSVSRTITLSGDVTGSVATNLSTNPTITTAIGSGVIVNADVNVSAAIDASKIADGTVSNTEFQRLDGVTSDIQSQINTKAASTDLNNLNASNLSSGTLANARLPSSISVSNVSGNGSGLTSLNGSNISSGTVADARISTLTASKLTGALPAIDGSALTGLSTGVPSSTTAVGSLRMFVHPTNRSNTGADSAHTAGSSYSGSVLANYTFSNQGYGTMVCTVSGSAIGTGTWLCLGPSGRFRRTSQGDAFHARWPGLFLRTS